MKVISFIVPTYNVEQYIDRCLSSIPSDREDVEVIVIIDGSQDSSQEIAMKYQKANPQVFRVVEKENGNYGSCVNVGLNLAKGKYIKLLDADDSLDIEADKYISFLKEVDTDVVLTNYVSVDVDDQEIQEKLFPIAKTRNSNLEEWITHGFQLMHHYELTYKTEFLKSNNYSQTEGIAYTDLEWCTIPFANASTYAFYPSVVYHYLKGRPGQTVSVEFRKKNMWMENKVVLGIVSKYEALKSSLLSTNEILLKTFSANLIRQVYYHYLINYPGQLEESELRSFDKELSQISDELYWTVEDTEDKRKFGKFLYIKDFRNKGTRKQIKYFYYDACMSIGNFIRMLKG